MSRHTLLLVTLLILSGCNDDGTSSKNRKSAEAARIEREVARRVQVERLAVSERKSRLQTYRVISYVVLAGGAVTGLLWLQRQRAFGSSQNQSRPLQLQSWTDHFPTPANRVFDNASPVSPPPRVRNETTNRP